MSMTEQSARKITGWHVLAMFVAFFGVIIAVNVTLAWQAIATFPGLEEENGYVASQSFDRERAAQQALGWTLQTAYDPQDKVLSLAFTDAKGQPVEVQDLQVLVGRTTEAKDDLHPAFVLEGGTYRAKADLAMGKWMMRIEAFSADGTKFHQRLDLHVRP